MVKVVKFTPDYEQIISAGQDNTIKIWDLIKKENIMELKEKFT